MLARRTLHAPTSSGRRPSLFTWGSAGLLLALVVACLAPAPAPATAREGSSRSVGRVPRKNFSFVHAETEWVRRAFGIAADAASANEWYRVAKTLQPVIANRTSRERDAGQSPYLRAVEGEETYEGAHLVAQQFIAAAGQSALEAYENEFGGTARMALERAAARRDVTGIEDVAATYLLTDAGETAALLRVDLALEAGDRDVAFEWLEALEDLEDVTAPDLGETGNARAAARRARRIARHARVIAAGPAEAAEAARILAAGKPGNASLDAIPMKLRRRAPAPTRWPTTGGNNARNAVPPRLGSALTWRWSVQPLADSADPEKRLDESTSPWHPPRVVTDARHAFVSDGNALHVIDLADGKERALYEYKDSFDVSRDTDEDPRLKFGLLEGHALTVATVAEAGGKAEGSIIFAAVPDGTSWPIEREPSHRQAPRDDRVEAIHWDGKQLTSLWVRGGGLGEGGLPDNTRLYGAPLVYRGKLWVAGIRPEKASGDRWQAWLFAFHPIQGHLLLQTHLGTGAPVRRGRLDEVIPTSPSADRGRVVVGTGLGIVTAVSARDGRAVWAYRHDRETDPERARRNNHQPSAGLRVTGFTNAPPILTVDRCVLAPVDGTSVLVLTNRPRGRSRTMRCQQLAREGAVVNMSIEQVVGVDPATGLLLLVGRGQDSDPPGPILAARDLYSGSRRFEHPGPTLLALEPYGRALLTTHEAFVSTRAGIAIYDLHKRGADLGVLELGMLPKEMRESFPVPYGNLVPVPGRGVLATTATTVTLWAR